MVPRDDRLHQGVGTATRRNRHLIVGQNGECAVQILLVDVAQGLDKGVVLTVTHSAAVILLAIDFDLDIGTRT